MADTVPGAHFHVFLGEGHERNERRTWMVIALCTVMMVVEIVGGLIFGSIALVADGLHMSTHASALCSLRWPTIMRAGMPRMTASVSAPASSAIWREFTSAIVLAMIAILIGYEAVTRLIWPVPIDFNEAIPIAALGLIVNVASVLLLSGGDLHPDHSHSHHHGHGASPARHDHEHDQAHSLQTSAGPSTLEIFEDGVPPRFRLSFRADACRGRLQHRDHTPGWGPANPSRWSRGQDIWNRSMKFPSRMRSPSASRLIAAAKFMRSSSRNMSMRMAQRSATTICDLPSSTCWRMREFRYW